MGVMGGADVFARLPAPPYYAVIFSSLRRMGVDDGYEAMAERMAQLACQQAGYLGAESSRDADGFGMTVSYWKDEASILVWKRHAEHQMAQETGRTRWYEHYEIRIAREPLHNAGEAVAVGSGWAARRLFLLIVGLLARKTTQQTARARLATDRRAVMQRLPRVERAYGR